MRLLLRSREVGTEVRDHVRVDDMHCVGRLFVLAAQQAGSAWLDASLARTLETMFEIEEAVGVGDHGSGNVASTGIDDG